MSAHIKECFLLETQMYALEVELASRDGRRYVNYDNWTLLDSLRSSVLHSQALLERRMLFLAPEAQAALAEYAQQFSSVENGCVDIDEV